MVSTRGGARTGDDDELTLRKKPVRKATTTTTTNKTTKATTKAASAAKTTRSKKPELEHEDEEEDELQAEHPASVAPAVTRKVRAKKDDASTNTTAQSKPAAASRARKTTTTAASRAAATRAAKASKAEGETADLAPSTQTKATRATRATASTRATAAKEKAPPLSPKKITQMPKVPARSTRIAIAKGTVEKGGSHAAPKGRTVTRRRNVSDENAGIPDFRASTAEQQGDDDVKPKQSVKSKSSVKAVPDLEKADVVNETPMSRRPTTPADTPQLQPDEIEELISEPEDQDSDSDAGRENEVSADELCGPKTPMKRTKHTSAQKETRLEDVPMETPVRRFLVLGSQRGTPQTQKPYRKPSFPVSEVRPTTVARARDRAVVFPKLQPLEASRELEEDDETGEDEGTSKSVGAEHRTEISTTLEQEEAQRKDCSLTPDYAAGLTVEEDCSAEIDASEDSIGDAEHRSMADDDVEERATVAIPFQMESLDHADRRSENGADEKLDDPNETIIVEDHEMADDPESQVDTSLHSEESVIIRHEMGADVDETFTVDDSMEDIRLPATTPRPETIVWENLREDVTIPFNFDSELSASREFDSRELSDPLSVNSDGKAETGSPEAAKGAAEYRAISETKLSMGLADIYHQRQSFGDVRLSVDATVNLSDFLDVSSLAESGQMSQLQDTTREDELDEHMIDMHDDDVDLDVTISRPSSERTAKLMKVPSTPVRESITTLPSVPQHEPHHMLEANTPHYAMSTAAFRRKSLPAIIYHTPMKNGARPKTSDGASIARVANPFVNMSTARDKTEQEMTPFRRRLSAARGVANVSRSQTPSVGTSGRTPAPKSQGTSGTPRQKQTPRTSSRLSVRPTPKERFPGLPSRQTYEDLVGTPGAKAPRSSTPPAAKSGIKERFPGLPPAETYEDFVKSPARTSPNTAVTPQAERPRTPVDEDITLPEQGERYPGLPHRRTYEEHARTAMPPSRFRTPSQSPAKRPATVQRPASLRKVALKANTPNGSRTPVKTPLRAPAMTPGQVPLTPHPGVPLRGVNAYVDVFLNDGSSANSTYIAVLHSLGAKTTKTFNDRVTHVVFKEGSPATLQRLRLHNKQVADSNKGNAIFCVNGRWVNDSNSEGARMDETDEAYSVDIEDQRATKRRRKSMEPTALLNSNGKVTRHTNRKSSLGRNSLGRAMKAGSPSVDLPAMQMSMDVAEKENSGDSSFGDGSPATPAYLAAPDSLVQQTAPLNRVRKLNFEAEQAKNRRLTFWNGGEF